MTEPARIMVPELEWIGVWENYRIKLRAHLKSEAPEKAEQAERIFLRCMGRLDGTYTGEY